MTTPTTVPAHFACSGRRLRLQDPAGRARGRRPRPGRPDLAGPARRARHRRRCRRHDRRARPRGRGDRRLLHSRRRRPLRLGPDRRGQRALRRLRDGRPPVLAVNLLSLAARKVPFSVAREVLRGGLDVAAAAGCLVGGGHSVDAPEPNYGMAVTGVAHPDRLLRNDSGRRRAAAHADQAARRRHPQQPAQGHRRGLPGGHRHHDDAQRRRLQRGARRGRQGRHRRHGLRPAGPPAASSPGPAACAAVVDADAVPYLDGARASLAEGTSAAARAQPRLGPPAPGPRRRSARTSCCCSPTPRPAAACSSAAELPGYPVVGELVDGPAGQITIR